MSPERKDLPTARDPDDDVYAFGLIVLEFLSGSRDKRAAELLKEVNKEQTFHKLDMVIRKCLMPRSNERYENAISLEKDWKHALDKDYKPNYVQALPVLISPKRSVNYSHQKIEDLVFDEKVLSRANFNNCIIKNCSFRRTALSSAVLNNSKIYDCNFDGAFMIGARIHDAIIENTSFKLANLERTVWDGVDLATIDFTGSNLWGAFLEKAINLEKAILNQTNFSRNLLNAEQELFLKNAININRADNYQSFFNAIKSLFDDKIPEELWWLKLVEDPDFMLYYY